MLKRLLGQLLLTTSAIVQAETFLGMEPLEPLSSIKQRYTAARVSTEPADWLKPNQYFGRLTTDEVSGTLLLLFEHDDETRKKKLIELEKVVANLPPNAHARSTRLLIRQQKEHLAKPLDDRLSLVLIRWIPQSALALSELTARYGKPDEKRPGDAHRGPTYVWNKGVTAHISDDKKSARMIEYWFTEDDLAVYFLRRDTASR
jgi:hypothetical protein